MFSLLIDQVLLNAEEQSIDISPGGIGKEDKESKDQEEEKRFGSSDLGVSWERGGGVELLRAKRVVRFEVGR